jgi:hypothetical protein
MRKTAERLHVSMLGICLVIFMGSVSLPAQESGTGRLKLRVKPYAAGVFVDGKYFGPATGQGWSLWYALPAGEHEVTLRDPRYQDFSTKVNIVAGQSTTLKQSMQTLPPPHPPYGVLRIQGGSSDYNAVYLNGRFMGHVDEFNNHFQGLKTTPGEYALKVVSLAGETELEEKVKLEEDKTTRVRVGAAR